MLRPLYSLAYIIARGGRGMAQAPAVQLLAVGTIAVCMLLLGAVVLAWSNAQGVVREKHTGAMSPQVWNSKFKSYFAAGGAS